MEWVEQARTREQTPGYLGIWGGRLGAGGRGQGAWTRAGLVRLRLGSGGEAELGLGLCLGLSRDLGLSRQWEGAGGPNGWLQRLFVCLLETAWAVCLS